MTSDPRTSPDAEAPGASVRDPARWNTRWLASDTPWDLGSAAFPLVRAIREGRVSPSRADGAPTRTIVLGCGAGHDARAFAAAGFDVTGIDFADAAVAKARAIAQIEGSPARFETADLFALPPHLAGADLLVEHTLFCAIDPSDRDRYVDAVHAALRPGGRILALFWLLRSETGPPFASTESELRTRFLRRFRLVHAECPHDSVPKRRGEEWLTVLERLP